MSDTIEIEALDQGFVITTSSRKEAYTDLETAIFEVCRFLLQTETADFVSEKDTKKFLKELANKESE